MKILAFSDTHYDPNPPEPLEIDGLREYRLGKEIIHRIIRDAKDRGGFDLVIITGDLINDGTLASCKELLLEAADTVRQAAGDVPVLVVPGNHDFNFPVVYQAFGTPPGVYDIGGYRFVIFADKYGHHDFCSRSAENLELIAQIASKPGGPVIALQHNPLYPVVDSRDYPYMPTNYSAITESYSKAGVLLSLSGHYHSGQPLSELGGVKYLTLPGACREPFGYYMIELDGLNVKAIPRQLNLNAAGNPKIVDAHAHTHFAYCASGVTFDLAIDRAKKFGVSRVYFCEHSPQLYCRDDDFWNHRHIDNPDLWKSGEFSRMDNFRREIVSQKSNFVKVGLEVEVDRDGTLIIHDEDRRWADLLVGAVHWTITDTTGMTDAQKIKEYMKTTELLLDGGVNVLAHPLRFFRRTKTPTPKDIYPVLAQMLADTNTAAEINFHTNAPDPDFFAQCIQRGVKITFGSDAHSPFEPASFNPHIDVLRAAAGCDDIQQFLLDL